MMKITFLATLMFFGVLYAARLSCDECGQECESACGTRRFRACCFNYLRKKRGPDAVEFWSNVEENRVKKSRKPVVLVQYIPEDVISTILGNSLRIPD